MTHLPRQYPIRYRQHECLQDMLKSNFGQQVGGGWEAIDMGWRRQPLQAKRGCTTPSACRPAAHTAPRTPCLTGFPCSYPLLAADLHAVLRGHRPAAARARVAAVLQGARAAARMGLCWAAASAQGLRRWAACHSRISRWPSTPAPLQASQPPCRWRTTTPSWSRCRSTQCASKRRCVRGCAALLQRVARCADWPVGVARSAGPRQSVGAKLARR